MANDTQAQKSEEKAQTEPMPSSDNKVSEGTDSLGVAPIKEEASGISADNSELPEGVSDRTKEQFDKLTGQISELKDQLTQQVVPSPAPEKPKEARKPLYDPNTGIVDIAALENLRTQTEEANARATKAEQGLKEFSASSETKDLYTAHPELQDPKTDADKELFNESERLWLHSQMSPEKYGNKALSQREAADLAKSRTQTSVTPEEQAKRATVKEQASLSATGKPSQGVAKELTADKQAQLATGTRMGDEQSMIERMRNIRQANAKAQS